MGTTEGAAVADPLLAPGSTLPSICAVGSPGALDVVVAAVAAVDPPVVALSQFVRGGALVGAGVGRGPAVAAAAVLAAAVAGAGAGAAALAALVG